MSRQQLHLLYTLFRDGISIYLSSIAPYPLYAVYRLYQYLSLVQTHPAPLHAVCRLYQHQFCRFIQAQLRYTLYVEYISLVVFHRPGSATRFMQTASVLSCYRGPAPLPAVYRLHQFCRVFWPGSATRCMKTASVFSCFIGPAPLHAVCRLYRYLSVVLHRPSSATRFMQTISIYLSCYTGPSPLHAVYRLYQYLSLVLHSPSSATRCMQTASVLSCYTGPALLHAVCRIHQFGRVSQARLRYTLYVDCVSFFRVTEAQLRYELYVDCISFVVFHRPGSSTRCMQTVSVSICRVSQAQLRYTLYVDCISIYLSCYTGPAPLHAVCRLYQYLSVVKSSSSAIRCMQTESVSICRVSQAQLRYTLYVDCTSIYFQCYTGPTPLHVVCRLFQYLSVVKSSSSAIRCMQTVSVSICRQELQLRYTLYVDCISIYLSSRAPSPLYAVLRLYQYLSVVKSSSSAIRCTQTVSVSICRQELQLRYTLYLDYIIIYLSSGASAPLYAVCRLYQYLSVVNSSSSAIRCMQTVSVSYCRQQLQLRYTMYVDCISIYLSSRAPAPLYPFFQTVSVSICRQQLQLRYTLYVDCISIYLSSRAPAPLYTVYRMYQYLSLVFHRPIFATCCMQNVSVSICRQQPQLRYMLYVDCIIIYLSSTAPALLHAVCRLYVST